MFSRNIYRYQYISNSFIDVEKPVLNVYLVPFTRCILEYI